MNDPHQELQKAVYGILTADSTLQGLIGGSTGDKKIYDRVPQEKAYPYLTIGDFQSEDRGNHTWEGIAGTLTINVWYREPNAGRKQVQNIQKAIDDLLHKAEPSLNGWNVILMRRSTRNILIEPDNVTFHGIQTFKIFLGEA